MEPHHIPDIGAHAISPHQFGPHENTDFPAEYQQQFTRGVDLIDLRKQHLPQENMEVPTTSSFEDIYPTDAASTQKKRWDVLLAAFEKEYGRKAGFVSRSPGRVNIIGEVRMLLTCTQVPVTDVEK